LPFEIGLALRFDWNPQVQILGRASLRGIIGFARESLGFPTSSRNHLDPASLPGRHKQRNRFDKGRDAFLDRSAPGAIMMTADTTSVSLPRTGPIRSRAFAIDFASRHRISPGFPGHGASRCCRMSPDTSRSVDDGLPATFVLKSFARHKHDLVAHRLYSRIFKTAQVMRRLKAQLAFDEKKPRRDAGD